MRPTTRIESRFQPVLMPDERLEWMAQPEMRLFRPADIFLVPFSLMWAGFAIFWEAAVLGLVWSEGHDAPLLFKLWGIPFVIVGFYMIFGRFIYLYWRKRNTYYAVNNQRALVLRDLFTRQLQAVFLDRIAHISARQRRGGGGDVLFADQPTWWTSWYVNTGFDFGGVPAAGFFDLKDVQLVADRLNRLRSRATRQTPSG